MIKVTRRGYLSRVIIGAALISISACKSNTLTKSGLEIENDAKKALETLFKLDKDSKSVYERAAGVLIMPTVSKASFVVGGAYGEGVLRIGGAPVDYYSIASASYGLQLGAQTYSHVLFFMTQEALREFRTTDGWQVGVDAEVTVRDKGYSYEVSSNTLSKPIYGIAYGQKGLIAGASFEGAKYSRLIRGL